MEAEQFWENHYAGRDRIWSGRPNALLADAVAGLAPGRALDLGCGEGGDAVHLAGLGWHVTAVDIAAGALRRTREAAGAAGVADRVGTGRYDLGLGFPEGTYELISAQYLQTPFDFPREDVLRRAAHALSPGGRLFVVEHGSLPPWAWNRGAHPRFQSPREIYDGLGLDPAGFEAERLESASREATGPAGETATVIDTVVAVRRR
jgi:SAM-dependent methyltransferase